VNSRLASETLEFMAIPFNNRRIAELCGPCNENLKQIESHFDVSIRHRSNVFEIIGESETIQTVRHLLNRLYEQTEQMKKNNLLTPKNLFLSFKEEKNMKHSSEDLQEIKTIIKPIQTKRRLIQPKGENQTRYVQSIRDFDINFAVGPAGTGKTYLAVACAIEALEKGYAQRLIFVRPAVEAGEKLGFLPGDLQEKVLPYLRPVYDALYDMLGCETVAEMVEQNVIEIAPLAFMRGRTLNDAFIILDEAQNTTSEQMKMFLTRIGFGSTVVITGDITQIDLDKHTRSGLVHSLTILKEIKEISFTFLTSEDAVRHPIIQSILRAYENEK
jgi:phosphate starvation-inducible PhoH-like protein